MIKKIIIIIGIVVLVSILSVLMYIESTKSNAPTIDNVPREPSKLCAIFGNSWNSNTQTCIGMSDVACGFSLGEWKECVMFENYCYPNDSCKAPDSCFSACIFEDSLAVISEP